MCGIFGYIGNRTDAAQIVFDGLKRLDYRGYDSWGVAVESNGEIFIEKKAGKIGDAKDINVLPAGKVAIAHTRWATTGAVTQVNAHPHFSTDKSFALAQNGIVENFEELRETVIKKGYTLISQTDTEVIVRLIEEKIKTTKDLFSAVREAFLDLEGRNTIIVITNTSKIYAARNGSPLVIGLNSKTQEAFISSDTLSFSSLADKMIAIDNGEMVVIDGNVAIYNIKSGKQIKHTEEEITIHSSKVDKEGYDHFMLKEIHENPYVINQLLRQDKAQYEELASAIKKAKTVYVIGSGTTGLASAQIAYYLRHFGRIKAISLVGADAREYYELFSKEDLLIAPSQSGETADVLEVLEYAKSRGVKIASIVNMPGSMMTRMSDYKFMCQAGAEICVMSTKVFISHIAWGYLLAKTVEGKFDEGRKNLEIVSKRCEEYLEDAKNAVDIKEISKHLLSKHDVFLLGKSQNFQIIREGMVKIIEATYKHAHAMPAGDLKHYAITLMEKGVPVIVVLSNDEVKTDVNMAINEVRLRGAEVIAIAPAKQENFDFYLSVPDVGETSAILNTIPLQLLAYYMAVGLGNNVDKPRNIAKSVTVK
ncbi:MAG TPA: glutamine--fructose-6-phosphate transaminase (isomerizing) [Candidatus Eisenbacteria bacterium]|nr:glutamine--fructose-6-phosphate transaminase (isomerizing) [Candidatus Eisenbacteria bacterium]